VTTSTPWPECLLKITTAMLSPDITVEGEVDPDTPGEYKLTYSVTDKNGVTTIVMRTIKVLEKKTDHTLTDTINPDERCSRQ